MHNSTSLGHVAFDRPLSLRVRIEEDGPVMASQPLRASDLTDLRAEYWQDLFLRQGLPDVGLDDVSLTVAAKLSRTGSGRCEGFAVTAEGPQHRRLQREYGISLFGDVASSVAQGLVAAGQMKASDTHYWHIATDDNARVEEPAAAAFSMTIKPTPLAYVTRPLAPLLKLAEPVGEVDDALPALLFVRRAAERAEKFSRRGADMHPAVETGAILFGVLVSCPDSGEFYAVVTDALELADADQKEFSLTYTGPTWQRLRAVLRARQALPGGQALRMLGQAHGHNFKPAGSPCAACATAKVCSTTSVFASLDDRAWTRAVMAQQPWAACSIYGLNARDEGVAQLYTLRGNQLQPRGYHVIDEFPL